MSELSRATATTPGLPAQAAPAATRLRLLGAVVVAAAGAVFLFDLLTPLGIADGMLYVPVVLVALWLPSDRAVIAVAAAGSVLTVAGFLLSPPAAVPSDLAPLVNRALALLAIWTSALLAVARLRSKERLRRAQGLADSLLDTARMLVVLLDAQGRIIRLNRFTEELLGMSSAAAAGRDWVGTFVPPAERPRVRDTLARALAGRRTRGNVNGVVTASGEVRQIEWFDNDLHDERGRVAAVLAIGNDITDRLRAEAEMRLRERSLAAARNGVVIADARAPACPIIYTNAAVTTITGFARDEVLGKGCQFLFGPDTDGRAGQEVEAALAECRPCRVTLKCHRKDGSTFWNELHVTPVYGEDGEPTHFIGILNDVTEREETLIALRTRNLELEALAELGRAFLSGMTLDQIRPRVVTLAHELLGVDRVGLFELGDDGALQLTAGLGWPYGTVGQLRVAPRPGSLLARALASQRPVETRDLDRDEGFAAAPIEERTFASAVGLPLCGRARTHGVLTVFSHGERPFGGDDLSFLQMLANTTAVAIEQRNADARLRRLQRELLRATRDAAVVDFGATIAHELNQPVTSVMNYVQAAAHLLADAPVPQSARAYMRKAVDEAERAGEIMRRLRQLVASGVTERRPADIAEIVRDAAQLALIDTAEHALELRYDFAPDVPAVPVDAVQVQQVVFNLVRNAVEAMPDVRAPKLRIATRRHDGEVEVLVEDHGPGFDEALLDDASRRFNSSKVDGLGIGLSICRSIVAAHGGRLWVTPTAGGGATFHFTLPLSPASR